MKKILATLISVLFVISAHAQFASSSSLGSFGKTTEAKRFVSYVKAGVSLNKFLYTNVEYGLQNSSIIVGYSAVYGFQYYFIENINLYFGVEIGVGTRGMCEKVGSWTLLQQIHMAKATPFQVGYKYNITDLIAVDAHIGAVISYDLTGRININYYDGSKVTRDYNEWKQIDGYKRFDVAINPGATIWIGDFGFDFTYQRGFIDVGTGSFHKEFTSNFILGLAYRF